MKKMITFIIFCMLAFSLTACSNTQQDRGAGNASGEDISQITTENISAQAPETEPVQTEDDTESDSSAFGEMGNGNILVDDKTINYTN